jgi:glycosyltransferase involved in cell wall biosynthesis
VQKPILRQDRDERAWLAAQYGLSNNTIVLGCFGRMFEYKQVSDAVAATGLLNKTAPRKFFLMVVGCAPNPTAYESQVRALAQTMCPQAHCFLPFTDDPFPLMGACDVLLMPSVEPFGRVLVEAMYLGIPFVATDTAGPKEIMEGADPLCGKLVPPMRPDLIADAVLQIVKNTKVEHPAVPHRLSQDGIVGSTVQFYRDVLDGRVRNAERAMVPAETTETGVSRQPQG